METFVKSVLKTLCPLTNKWQFWVVPYIPLCRRPLPPSGSCFGGKFLLRIKGKYLTRSTTKLLSVCTQSRLDSLPFITPRQGRTLNIYCPCPLYVLKASGSNRVKNKKLWSGIRHLPTPMLSTNENHHLFIDDASPLNAYWTDQLQSVIGLKIDLVEVYLKDF